MLALSQIKELLRQNEFPMVFIATKEIWIYLIKEHFRKYINPNNMFVLPKEIGYLGEIDVFIEE